MISKKELNRVYDILYTKGQEILNKYQPCKAEDGGPCIHGTFCCNGCPWKKSNGCVVKCLYCKLWLCQAAKKACPEAEKELAKLRTIQHKYIFPEGRHTKRHAISFSSKHRFSIKEEPLKEYI